MRADHLHIVFSEGKQNPVSFITPHKATPLNIIQSKLDPTMDSIKEYLISISLKIKPPLHVHLNGFGR
jgi:hypothetical protein